MKNKKFGPYKNAKDLASKINWEGGISSFFLDYSGAEPFKDSELYPEVKQFIDAYDSLVDKLNELGVDLDEEE